MLSKNLAGVKDLGYTHSLEGAVLACSDRARLLIAGGLGAAVTPLVALGNASQGALVLAVATVLEMRAFTVPWLLTGSVLLLDRSSGLVCVGDVAEAEGKRIQEILKHSECLPCQR